ncbi:MAG: M56 family metallopeptidase [Planctomycetales bacterium]|jgi:beta-lactamase regulating signal transducer with metallopeptidase domain
MVALTFSQFADVASPLAWQLTLTLLHVLWIGVAIAALAIFGDRVLARGTGDSASPDFGSANTRARYWLNLTALVVLATALPITFLVVRDSAAQLGKSTSSLMAESDESGSSNQDDAARLDNSASNVMSTTKNDSTIGHLARRLPIAAAPQGEAGVPLQESLLNQLRSVAPAIAIMYLAGVLMMLVRLAAALCGGQRLTSLGYPVAEQSVLDVLTAQAERLDLKAVPMVAYCERVAVPVVVGVLKPVILLPAAMMSGLSSQELAAVLAHVKRFDHVLIVVQRFLEAVLFFHPAVWWLGRRIHDLREHACDDLVIQGGTDRMEYARSLLRVAELRVGDDARSAQLAQLALDGGDPSKLRQRIQRIVQSNDEPGVRLNQSRATFTLVASAMAIALSLIPVLPGISEKPVDAAATSDVAAEESSADTTSAGDVVKDERSIVDQKLEESAELHVEEMPLIAVLDAVEKLSGIPVTVDLSDFKMRGVNPHTPITIDVENVTVQALFEQIVRQAHLTFEIEADGIVIPANTPALEFRIVPGLPDSGSKVRVPDNWGNLHFRDGTVEGMGTAQHKGFAWFPVQKNGVSNVDVPVSAVSGKSQFALLSDAPHQVLVTDGSWHVKSVEIQNDQPGQPVIQIVLDEAGGRRMLNLTKSYPLQKMAVVVNGAVILAPILNAAIGQKITIAGSFSNDELTTIADGIRGAILPPGKELTYKCDVMDEKTGKPIAGAEVMWRVRRNSFQQDEIPLFEARLTTDNEGRYTVRLPGEAFEFAQLTTEFEVTHPDYLPKKRVGTRLTLPDATKPRWSDLRHLKLRPGVPVTGRFIEPDGSPAANLVLMVSVNRDGPGQGYPGDVVCRTDNDGHYRVVTSPGWPKRLHWYPEDFVSDSVALSKKTDRPEAITFGDQGTIRLKTGPRLTGLVLDQNGDPLDSVTVRASTGTRIPIRYATSDARGEFIFSPLPPAEYHVSTIGGFDPLIDGRRSQQFTILFSQATVTLPINGKPTPVTIQQPKSDMVTVIAIDENGGPALDHKF